MEPDWCVIEHGAGMMEYLTVKKTRNFAKEKSQLNKAKLASLFTLSAYVE